MLLRPLLLAALVAGLVLGAVAPAQAARSQTLYFDGAGALTRPESRPAALEDLEALGVRALRLVLYWKDVAPAPTSRTRPGGDLTDPAAYNWGEYDAIMAAASERGWPVLLTPTTPGPKWAMRGTRDHVTRPDPRAFGQFITALGRRYGDQVVTWSIGNEPNHPDFLRPQFKGKTPVSPGIYRPLFASAARALKATGNGGDTVLAGETAPRGNSKVVAPLRFLRGMLCLDGRYRKRGRCSRLPIDGFAHHPYTTKSGPFFVPPAKDDVTIGVLPRLTKALDRAARAGTVRRSLPIWLTEFGVQSTPDRFAGVSLQRQNEFRAIGERLAWGNPRVRAFSQFLLTDDQPIENVPARSRYGGFESGLRFANGRAKPSHKGFRLPLVALRTGRRVSLWGMVRPATAATSVDVLVNDRGNGRLRLLKTVTTDSRGVLRLTTSFRAGRQYRLRWQGTAGASVRPYKRG